MLFKTYIQSLSKVQLFQLYLLITIIVLFPYFKFLDNSKTKSEHRDTELVKINSNIKNIKKQLVIPNHIKILKDIEKKANSYKSLKIESFSINKNSISLNGTSNKNEFLSFLIFCENYSVSSRLNSLSLHNLNTPNHYNFSFTLKFKKKYLEKISQKEQKTMEDKLLALDNKKAKKAFRLQAILNSQVIIDDKLLALGDSYKNYKIQKISKDHIVLIKDRSIKKLYLNGIKHDL